MTWAPIGAPVKGENRFHYPVALAVAPTLNNVLILACSADENTDPTNPNPSGGGVTTWNLIRSISSLVSSLNSFVYWGLVTTGGAATLSLTSANNGTAGIVQEFSTSASFIQDPVGGALGASALAASGNYPSITPAAPGALCVGSLATRAPGPASGTDPNFTYVEFQSTYIGAMQFVYNLNAVGPQSPNWSLGAAADFAVVDGFLSPPSLNANKLLI